MDAAVDRVNFRPEFPLRKYAAQPRSMGLRSATTADTGRSVFERAVTA
nr:hypothetical protein [Streptomyces sasae]